MANSGHTPRGDFAVGGRCMGIQLLQQKPGWNSVPSSGRNETHSWHFLTLNTFFSILSIPPREKSWVFREMVHWRTFWQALLQHFTTYQIFEIFETACSLISLISLIRQSSLLRLSWCPHWLHLGSTLAPGSTCLRVIVPSRRPWLLVSQSSGLTWWIHVVSTREERDVNLFRWYN